MRRPLLALLVACGSAIASGAPAAACDPDWDWCGYSWYDEPAYVEPAWSSSSWWWEPDPVYVPDPVVTYTPVADDPSTFWSAPADEPAPIWSGPAPFSSPPEPAEQSAVAPSSAASLSWPEPVVWESPGADVLDAVAEPAPLASAAGQTAQAAERGLHLVTDVYAGDSVIIEGLTTTYTSSTVRADPGTAARLVATVGTGQASSLDGLLWNGRTSLSDGRLVSGDIYANHVWDGWDWVFDKYVFFQDDRETAQLSRPVVIFAPPTTVAAVPPALTPSAVEVAAAPGPLPALSAPIGEGAPALVTPLVDNDPSAAETAAPPAPGTTRPRSHDVRTGVALAPQGDVLGRIEVLRGRRVRLWMRATVDGAPARVIRWQLVSGELSALGPVSGPGDDPLVATWTSLAPSGAAFVLWIAVTVDVPDEGLRDVGASIDVVVRSPALVQ